MRDYLTAVCLPDQEVNQLFRHLGICVDKMEDGKAILSLPITPALGQGVGLVAGGVLATLADEAMAHAVMSVIQNKAVTLEMNIRYLRASKASQQGHLVANAEVIKKGSTVITTQAEVKDSAGVLLATAGASFFMLQK